MNAICSCDLNIEDNLLDTKSKQQYLVDGRISFSLSFSVGFETLNFVLLFKYTAYIVNV